MKSKKNKTKQNKKTKQNSSFCNFSSFHIKYFTFAFSIFLLFQPISLFFFLAYLFPDRSAEISPSEVWAGTLPPYNPPPPPVTLMPFNLINQKTCKTKTKKMQTPNGKVTSRGHNESHHLFRINNLYDPVYDVAPAMKGPAALSIVPWNVSLHCSNT